MERMGTTGRLWNGNLAGNMRILYFIRNKSDKTWSGACSFRLAVSFASRPCHSFQRSVLAFRYSHSARYALGTACRRSQQKGIPLSLYGPQRSPQSNAMIGELKSAYNRAKSISESRGIINPSEDTTKFTTLLLIFAYIEFRPAQSGLTRIRV